MTLLNLPRQQQQRVSVQPVPRRRYSVSNLISQQYTSTQVPQYGTTASVMAQKNLPQRRPLARTSEIISKLSTTSLQSPSSMHPSSSSAESCFGKIVELPARAASLLKEWLDAVVKSPVQSVFVGSPSVTLEQFVEHLLELLRILRVEENLLLPTIMYVRRIMDNGQFVVSWKNVWRLMLASTVVTVKYSADERLFNSDFAKIIGLTVPDINALEMQFLSLVNFELYASEMEYQKIRTAVSGRPLGSMPTMSGH